MGPNAESCREIDVLYMLKWFRSRPKTEIIGKYQSIQVQCGDIQLLKRGIVSEPVLQLWCSEKCASQDQIVLVNWEIFKRFYRGGPEQVSSWTGTTTIHRNSQVLIPVQNGKLWDLIVLSADIKQGKYYCLSGGDADMRTMVQSALSLVVNANIDQCWVDNATSFNVVFETFGPESPNLPPTIICHYLERLAKNELPQAPDSKALLIEVAQSVLGLVNGTLESYCVCSNTMKTELMIQCDNPYCKPRWFHLECTTLDSVPNGAWYCQECSVLR